MACVLAHGAAKAGSGGGPTSIAEREVLRRQALVTGAETQLAEAATLLRAGKTEEAVSLYSQIYQSLPEAAMAADAKARARAGFGTASCAWATKLMSEARYAEAAQALDAVLAPSVDPGNAEAKKLKELFADTDRYPPALTPSHIASVKKVQELLQFAQSFFELGDYDQAIAKYQEVLRVDAFNTAARRGLERVEQARAHYFDAARDHTKSALLSEVDRQWETALPPGEADLNAIFGASEQARAAMAGQRVDIIDKLRNQMLPKLDFNGATLEEVMEFLRIRSRDLDPKGRGVDFVLNVPAETRSKQITLSLEQVPMEEALRYVTQMAGCAYRVEERAVLIVSLTEKSTSLVMKTYRVPPSFIQTAPVDAAPAQGTDPFAQQPAAGGGGGLGLRRLGAREFLESRGVTFPEGASASYNAASSTLMVRNTVDNLAIVDSLVDQALSSAPKQVIVSVKIMEVNNSLFNEIGTDLALGQGNLPGSERLFFSGGGDTNVAGATIPGVNSMTQGIRSSGAILGKPSIDGLLTNHEGLPTLDSVSQGAVRLLGVFTDPAFEFTLRAVAQKKGVDLLAVPSVVTKGGVKATLVSAREFPYPTEFDPPEIPQTLDLTGAVAINLLTGSVTQQVSGTPPVTPTTPTAFEVKNVGITLDVEPVISDDGREIEVTLSPQSTEFEGFVDYGSDITNTSFSSSFDPVAFAFSNRALNFNVDNPILQPVFRTNKLNTSVKVWDGSTIVLGGVASETTTDIKDKVPILGDIPIIGKLWQSSVKKTEQKNILFFVTVKVVDSSGKPIRQDVKDTAAR